ncbi:MAG: hypothetical protein RLN90_09635 [Balneolaceae bacterium]
MKAVEFPEMNIKIAEDQDEFETLPAHLTEDGRVIACFELDEDEKTQIMLSGKIYLQVYTGGKSLQPIGMSLMYPFQIKPKTKN